MSQGLNHLYVPDLTLGIIVPAVVEAPDNLQ